MDKDENRRGIAVRTENVELLDRARAIRPAQRQADALAGALAVARPAVSQLLDVGLISRLIIGGVELGLIVIEKDARPFLMRRRPQPTGSRHSPDDRFAHSAGCCAYGRNSAKHLSELKILGRTSCPGFICHAGQGLRGHCIRRGVQAANGFDCRRAFRAYETDRALDENGSSPSIPMLTMRRGRMRKI